MIKRTLILFFLIVHQVLVGQSVTDLISNTKKSLDTSTTLKHKAKFTADLAWYYSHVNIDSALVYGNKSIEFATRSNNDTLIGQSLNDLSTVYFFKGDYPESINYARKSMVYRQRLKDTLGIASLYTKMGSNYSKTNLLDSTVYYYIRARDLYLKNNDSLNSVTIESNIASAYYSAGNYKKASGYLDECIDYFKRNNLKRLLANSYLTKGNIYLNTNDTLSSIKSFQEAEKLSAEIKNYVGQASALNNLSIIYSALNEFDKSTNYVKRSIEIRESIGATGDLESAKLTLAINNFKLGKIQDSKAGLLNVKGFFIKTGVNEKLQYVYENLMLIYAYENNIDSLNFYSQKYNQTLRKNISEANLKFSQEIEVKYETEKKEKEILKQRSEIIENKLNLNKKNTQLIGLGFLAIVLSVLGYLLYNQQKLKNQQLKKEGELKEALVKIETQNRLQEQRLRISRDLHDNIGAQLTFIISSIENLQYGFKLKNQKLTDKLSSISGFTKETIYELRDTIWAMNKNAISLEDLEIRISNFIDKADMSSNSLSFEFNIDKSVAKTEELASVKGMNIYRIIQEAINNSIKYAEASIVKVDILKQNKKIQFRITDNGKGFDENSVEQGNGLNNMKKRAKEIGASLDVNSQLNNGTEISINLSV
ncbi:tetratricopeptide repeat protein [Algibacter sp. R77976]|uniref:tetratricopeptide repeat-containing sensor histidine kinase n=1 Tax=Algibacter sp. R77976 TaxID=3093873 RepID=UPI0037C990B8